MSTESESTRKSYVYHRRTLSYTENSFRTSWWNLEEHFLHSVLFFKHREILLSGKMSFLWNETFQRNTRDYLLHFLLLKWIEAFYYRIERVTLFTKSCLFLQSFWWNITLHTRNDSSLKIEKFFYFRMLSKTLKAFFFFLRRIYVSFCNNIELVFRLNVRIELANFQKQSIYFKRCWVM